MYTEEDTTGYTSAELAEINAELAARLSAEPEADFDRQQEITKAFADEVSRR